MHIMVMTTKRIAGLSLLFPKGMAVHARAPEQMVGEVIGTYSACQLTSCGGVRVWVRWPDGRLTKPCTKGLDLRDGEAWIV